jgi:arylsulfatase A-like enzyme
MDRPNILILLTDQQRHDTINAAGFSHMKTPNLDRLAKEGCLWENAYSPCPVCMPGRHCMLTGMIPKYHGYYTNKEEPIADDGLPTIPRILSENGYQTGAVGKMHFYPPRRHHGFEHLSLMEEIPESVANDEYLQYLKINGMAELRNIHGIRPGLYHTPQKSLIPKEHHGSNWVAKESIDWLKKTDDRKPFFLMCGWIQPHPPWNIPEEYQSLYEGVDIPEPISGSRSFPHHTGKSEWYGDNDSKETVESVRKTYYTAISMVDEAVGKIIAYLEKRGILDNTLVIFTSDHGEMLYDHGYFSKEIPYESSTRVPLIVRYPRLFDAGKRESGFADLYDVFPTLLDICKIDYPDKNADEKHQLVGHSLLTPDKKEHQFCEYGNGLLRWVSLRGERYKYVYHYNGGVEYFYDLITDPSELNNLIFGELPENEYEKLKGECIKIESERAPDGFIRNGQPVPFDAEEIGISLGSKFPLWSNRQYQTFCRTEKERDLFLKEWKEVLTHARVKCFSGVPDDKLWHEDFSANIGNLGIEEKELL